MGGYLHQNPFISDVNLKGSRHENRTGQNVRKDANNKKLLNNPVNDPEESISNRDEDIDNDDTRGGK